MDVLEQLRLAILPIKLSWNYKTKTRERLHHLDYWFDLTRIWTADCKTNESFAIEATKALMVANVNYEYIKQTFKRKPKDMTFKEYEERKLRIYKLYKDFILFCKDNLPKENET